MTLYSYRKYRNLAIRINKVFSAEDNGTIVDGEEVFLLKRSDLKKLLYVINKLPKVLDALEKGSMK